MPQNGLSGLTVSSNLLGHTSRWLVLPFPSPFNPIRATLDVIYLFIYLFSKDVTDSYQGRSGAFFLVKRWLTSSHRSVSSSAVAGDGSGDRRLCVCVCLCVWVCALCVAESIVQIWVCFSGRGSWLYTRTLTRLIRTLFSAYFWHCFIFLSNEWTFFWTHSNICIKRCFFPVMFMVRKASAKCLKCKSTTFQSSCFNICISVPGLLALHNIIIYDLRVGFNNLTTGCF